MLQSVSELRARDLKPGDVVITPHGSAKLVSTTIQNGKNGQRLAFIIGGHEKQACAIQLVFDDGEERIAHPNDLFFLDAQAALSRIRSGATASGDTW